MKIGSREFDVRNRTYIMGILNITPDSFSDGGRWLNPDAAFMHAAEMVREGADILDVGGESTRPGYQMVTEEEEIARIVPVIEKLKQEFDVPVSVDTYKSKVAKAAIAAGADFINDIWGLKYDPKMARVIADAGVVCCLMHNRQVQADGKAMPVVLEELAQSAAIAKEAGILEDKIILDPGVGFGKSYEQNLEVLRELAQLKALGYPVLLGASRKSVIGLTLDLPVTERLEGTLVTTVLAVLQHCSFVRVHDIRENVRVIRMTETILGDRNWM